MAHKLNVSQQCPVIKKKSSVPVRVTAARATKGIKNMTSGDRVGDQGFSQRRRKWRGDMKLVFSSLCDDCEGKVYLLHLFCYWDIVKQV